MVLFLAPPCVLAAPVRPATRHFVAPAANTPTAYSKGMELIRQRRIDDALTTFRSGLEVDPRNLLLLDGVGAAYSLKGDSERAIQYFQASLEINPLFTPARKNLAITYFELGRYDLSKKQFELLKTSPGASAATVNLFLGMLRERSGDYQAAAELLQQTGSLLYDYPEALLALASAKVRTGQPQRAEAALHALESRSKITGSEYMRAADLYSELGQHRHALECLDKARMRDGSLEGLRYRRAVILDRMGQSDEALELLKVLAAEKPTSETLNLLAHIAQKTRNFALAMQSLREAAKRDPSREDNYLDFSTICADYGNYPLALEAAEIGLDHLPGSYRLLVQKGVVLEELGRIPEAQQALRDASSLEKDNSVALLSLAIVQSHAGQLSEAERTLSDALQRFPENFYMHYQLGKVVLQLQENESSDSKLQARAVQQFRLAIHNKPSFADAYYQLAKLTLRDDPHGAEENLRTCLRLDPDHAAADYTLGRMYLSTGRRAAGQLLIDRFEALQKKAKLKEQEQPRIEAAQR